MNEIVPRRPRNPKRERGRACETFTIACSAPADFRSLWFDSPRNSGIQTSEVLSGGHVFLGKTSEVNNLAIARAVNVRDFGSRNVRKEGHSAPLTPSLSPEPPLPREENRYGGEGDLPTDIFAAHAVVTVPRPSYALAHASGYRVVLFCVILSCCLPAVSAEKRKEVASKSTRLTIQTQLQKYRQDFREKIEALAVRAENAAEAEEAQIIRDVALPPESLAKGEIDHLPETVLAEISQALPAETRGRMEQLRKLRAEFAQDLFLLSNRVMAADPPQPSLAYQLIREAAYHNPDHQLARKKLGYVLYHDAWVTPFAQRMLRAGRKWDSRWGWLTDADRERYEKGLRNLNGRWVTVSEEETARHEFAKGWEVRTEHFLIKTNHSLERGVELGAQLEEFHRFFLREFSSVFSHGSQTNRLLENNGTEQKPYEVYYFRTRDEFVHRLKAKQPGVESINGLYMPSDRKSYFFDDPKVPDGNEETQYHEVTHQILSESTTRTYLDVGEEHNFWVIEGFACYLESFQHEGDRCSAGDPHHVRIRNARTRVMDDHLHEPLGSYMAMGKREFQGAADLSQLRGYYSQGAALVHFFLHYQNGLYRDDFLKHLSQIYSPSDKTRHVPDTLSELTGVSASTLDRQFLDYLEKLNTDTTD